MTKRILPLVITNNFSFWHVLIERPLWGWANCVDFTSNYVAQKFHSSTNFPSPMDKIRIGQKNLQAVWRTRLGEYKTINKIVNLVGHQPGCLHSWTWLTGDTWPKVGHFNVYLYQHDRVQKTFMIKTDDWILIVLIQWLTRCSCYQTFSCSSFWTHGR